MQNQLGRNCPALELLSLGENPLTSISEYTGGLEKLYSLNLNITRVPEWSDLDKMREYPSLTELRIKHCPVLEEYTAHERRMMLVARLPNIQVKSNLFPVEISRKTDKILVSREKLSRNWLLKYEQSECFKLAIRDIFRIRNDIFFWNRDRNG